MAYPVQRRYERAPVPLEVVVEGASGRYEARTGDISVGGCFIDVMSHAASGEVISLKLHTPTGEWVYVRGEVVYEQWPTGFGVRFVEPSAEVQRSLAATIAEYRNKGAS